ncbi:DNA-formamidopyrimidine glycosylase family protein [Massilia endophytica]|uniref:DNA-formamidopyrimidine glycosylase family protein n=1 Tax=Massilia endophytica TaxID=2899220 RepID=UPI001E63D754|nr:DNA-formamidopyrimidine glycosylase family protein [Massilia endophytica]UGQ46885.1 endonuclease [Massilia endophytica]
MPEGPSLVILRELAREFEGRTIASAHGNSKAVRFEHLVGQPIIALRTWGKHFLIELPLVTLRIHFLMFGSYRINERKENSPPRLALGFEEGGELNFYTCAVKEIEGDLSEHYDWRVDVMSDEWKPALALKQLRAKPDMLACDALLDQTIFSGVGNIIKNEVLFRIRVHPLSTVGSLPAAKLRELVKQARQYSFEFLEWKKAYVLKQHWLAHTKRICPRCNIPFSKGHLGQTRRRSFWCERCQKRYEASGVL